MNFKTLHNYLASIALLAVVLSFSGFTSVSTNYTKFQTELVVQQTTKREAKTKYYKTKHRPRLCINQFTIFNFKSLLLTQNFNFKISLKTQKEVELQFQNFDAILKQNRIAKQLSNDSFSIELD